MPPTPRLATTWCVISVRHRCDTLAKPRERAPGWISTVSARGYFAVCGFSRLPCLSIERDRNACAFFRSSFSLLETDARRSRRNDRRLLQVAVQISTKTCGPCKVVYPHFAALSEELTDVTFCKIMGDHDADTRALMKEWGVRVVPLFMLFRNGEKVTEWSGAKPDVLRENVLEGCTDAEKASIVSA